MAARDYDYPEYATVEAHSTSIQTEENIAYETGMQSMDTKPNIAYATVMQGHSPRTQEHNTSLWDSLISLSASLRTVLTAMVNIREEGLVGTLCMNVIEFALCPSATYL